MHKMNLCSWCIQGLRSHGLRIYVGDYVEAKCDECEEYDDTVNECIVEED